MGTTVMHGHPANPAEAMLAHAKRCILAQYGPNYKIYPAACWAEKEAEARWAPTATVPLLPAAGGQP